MRTLYVVATATVACLIPFFSALMGLVGALGFTPLSFSLPPLFWLKVRPLSYSAVQLLVNSWCSG